MSDTGDTAEGTPPPPAELPRPEDGAGQPAQLVVVPDPGSAADSAEQGPPPYVNPETFTEAVAQQLRRLGLTLPAMGYDSLPGADTESDTTKWKVGKVRRRTGYGLGAATVLAFGKLFLWSADALTKISFPHDLTYYQFVLEILKVAAANDDVLIPFVSVDPHRANAAAEARRLIEKGARGFKFHPNLQGFFPNDRLAYPLYEVIAAAGVPALFHTGHSGMGSGMPGGGGIRLKYSNPMHVDDVAVDFPTLPIVLAHPSFPWQEEALSVAMHKAQVYIDLSGWAPKLFPPILVQYLNGPLRQKMLFGSDYPVLTPERWLAEFADLQIRDEVRPLVLKQNAARLLGL